MSRRGRFESKRCETSVSALSFFGLVFTSGIVIPSTPSNISLAMCAQFAPFRRRNAFFVRRKLIDILIAWPILAAAVRVNNFVCETCLVLSLLLSTAPERCRNIEILLYNWVMRAIFQDVPPDILTLIFFVGDEFVSISGRQQILHPNLSFGVRLLGEEARNARI